jgi:hypothetical protein
MNEKANRHHREQSQLTSEPAAPRRAVPTYDQKQAEADRLARQVAGHLASGGKVLIAATGESGTKDYRNPVAPKSRAQKARR